MISRNFVSTSAKLSQEVGEAVSRCRDGEKNHRATQPSKRQEAAEGRAARERLSPTHVLSSKHVFPAVACGGVRAGNATELDGNQGHVTANGGGDAAEFPETEEFCRPQPSRPPAGGGET